MAFHKIIGVIFYLSKKKWQYFQTCSRLNLLPKMLQFFSQVKSKIGESCSLIFFLTNSIVCFTYFIVKRNQIMLFISWTSLLTKSFVGALWSPLASFLVAICGFLSLMATSDYAPSYPLQSNHWHLGAGTQIHMT